MSVFTTENMRSIGVGQTITTNASYAEAQTIRTLANRLKMFDEYEKNGVDLTVHFDKSDGKVSVTKVKL